MVKNRKYRNQNLNYQNILLDIDGFSKWMATGEDIDTSG